MFSHPVVEILLCFDLNYSLDLDEGNNFSFNKIKIWFLKEN
jgi:hypothetical protein